MKQTHSTGFSLLEVVLYMGIFSLVVVHISSIYGTLIEITQTHEKRIQTETIGATVLDDLNKQRIRGESITFPQGSTSYTVEDTRISDELLEHGFVQTTVEFSINTIPFSFSYVQEQ